MAEGLTPRQESVLRLIVQGIQERGYPPTFREIGQHEGISSTNGVRGILDALEKKGYVERKRYQSRAIELTDKAKRFLFGDRPSDESSVYSVELSDAIMPTSRIVTIPVIGNVAAGSPILAEENTEGHIAIDADYAPRGETFALRIRGDSMIEAGIHDDDIVFCRVQDDAEQGEIVVALIGDEATAKYYHPERDRVVLKPANQYYGPIVVERDAPGFRILGKVMGLYRKY
ncbi:transcriptional repressor LexA [bacterium]|nr:transcriptional repressor LexA [bacterium]